MSPERRRGLRAVIQLISGMVFFFGCAARSPAEHLPPEYVRAEVQLGRSSPVLSESHIDTLNRYASTVRVGTAFMVPGQGDKIKTCSGVLIHPQVVLTAGHCVCHERRPIPPEASHVTVIDRLSCARTASVTLTRYPLVRQADRPNSEEESWEPMAVEEAHTGTVQVHEDVRIIYETNEGEGRDTEYSNADLAVIILKKPLPWRQVEPVILSDRPVQLREKVLLVGYGAGELKGGLAGRHRRYGENEVASIKSDGSTFHVGKQVEIEPFYRGDKPEVLRRRGSYAAAGDSGGPCFRERRGVLELVGIARSTSGPPVVLSVYTSTYKYLGWLREKIKALDSGDRD
jgi:hypothetical protein